MYSPKIEEELIPKIYQLAKAKDTRMTTLVNEILSKALNGMEGKEDEWRNKDGDALLEGLAKIKAEIQAIQLWIDDARTNRIARIRYEKTKQRLKNLIEAHKSLFLRFKRLKGWR